MVRRISDSITFFLLTSASFFYTSSTDASANLLLSTSSIRWLSDFQMGMLAKIPSTTVESAMVQDANLGLTKNSVPINKSAIRSYFYNNSNQRIFTRKTLFPSYSPYNNHFNVSFSMVSNVYYFPFRKNLTKREKTLLFNVSSFTEGSAPGETLEEGIENRVVVRVPTFDDVNLYLEVIHGKDPDHQRRDPFPMVENEFYVGFEQLN